MPRDFSRLRSCQFAFRVTSGLLSMINVSTLLQHCDNLQHRLSECRELPEFDCNTIDHLVCQQYHDHWKSHTDLDDGKYSRNPQYWIDRIDSWIGDQLLEAGLTPDESQPLNTETPGRAFQRLCELKFELQRLEQVCDSLDVSAGTRQSFQQRLAVCMLQIDDITKSLQCLVDAIFCGHIGHRSYQQIHMYNDPQMNTYLRQAERHMAG